MKNITKNTSHNKYKEIISHKKENFINNSDKGNRKNNDLPDQSRNMQSDQNPLIRENQSKEKGGNLIYEEKFVEILT